MSVKREADDSDGSDLKKRKVLDVLSEDGPLTQKDVVYFQKEAIFRQLQKYKTQVSVVQGEYKLLQTEYAECKDRFVLLSHWVDHFLEYVSGLAPTGETTIQSLQYFLSTPTSVTGGDFMAQLETKKQRFGEVVARFDGKISEDVKTSIASINKEFHNVSAKYDSLKSDNQLLTKKYGKLLNDFKEMSKENEVLQSKTLRRITKRKEETPNAEQATGQSRSNSVKTDSGAAPAVDDTKLEDLQAQISEHKATVKAQEAVIKENIERFGKLSSSIKPQTTTTEELITTSDKYRTLLRQRDDLQGKQAELVQRLEILENDYKDSTDQLSHQEKAMEIFTIEKNKLSVQLNETKEREERLRNQRDLYLTEIEVLKQKSNWKVLADLQELVKAQQQQIASFSLETKLNEIISSDTVDVAQLQKKNGLLLKELSELENAFQQLQSVRVPKILSAVDEEKRKKELDVAKIKVDSKYRMLMEGEKYQQVTRDKLDTSFKVLKTSFDKLESSQLEYKHQIETLNSELTDLKRLLAKKELEVKEYSNKCIKLDDRAKLESTQHKKARQDYSTLNEEHQSLLISEASKVSQVAQLKSKLASQDKLIMRFKQTGSMEDSSELDSFRSLIYCSLCSKNWKDTAIKTCGHVFCSSCANERLAARMRKCPSCNKQFSSNDLLTIHM